MVALIHNAQLMDFVKNSVLTVFPEIETYEMKSGSTFRLYIENQNVINF